MLRPSAVVSRGGRGRRIGVAAALAGLVLSPLAVLTPAAANPVGTGLVISEVYGAGGNGTGSSFRPDFIELYNPTAAPINVNGWSVQYRAAAGTSVGTNITLLTGSIPANSHYLVAEALGADTTAPALPTPDVIGTIAMGGGAGQVLLVNSTTASTVGTGDLAGNANLIDMVGYGAASSFEGAPTGVALTNVTSASRNATGADTDNNATDFSEQTPDPQNSGPVTPAALEATAPGNKSGQVGSPVAGFTLAATGGTSPYSWSATGLPDGVTVAANGAVSGTPTTAGTYPVTATVTDSAAPTPATDNVAFTYTITAAATLRPIAEIQGTGVASPLAGTTVITEGVVTALYPVGGFNGFFIQTEGTGSGADATPGASDGMFVFGGAIDESTLAVGDFVQVTGAVSEFFTSTQITPAAAGDVVIQNGKTHTDPVAQAAALPGTTCAVGACPTATELAADREAHEGELYAPAGPFTVTNSFSLTNGGNGFMEIGLAADTKPLIAPTEVSDFQTGNVAELTAYNAAHSVILDDGSSFNYTAGNNGALPRESGIAMPWINATHTVRVGAEATFTGPVILDYRNNNWKLQPTSQVTGIGANVATFEQTRADNLAPTDVGGDLVLGTFNVLNYFNTTGEAWVGTGRTCSFFNDRQLNPITNNSCSENGPRGAARTADFERQQAKIVRAINTMGADVVSLEEIENSIALGESNRDDALSALVTALNADAGSTRWAFAPSPDAADLPPTAEQDVIRTAFIYDPAKVALVGESDVLADAPAFANAREPLAQAFKKVGNPDASAFGVIVNHFKSKSTTGASGDNLDTGQGGFNGDRTRQAAALVGFADAFKAARGITKMFLTGDFNSYTEEDPVQALVAAGYTQVESDTEGEESYSFSGLSGSLDHVFANEAAFGDVTGADIWDINASEPLAYQYSRFNYNVTNFFDASNPFNSSDHNPEVIGIDVAPTPSSVSATAAVITYGAAGSVVATVTPSDATGTVTVSLDANQLGSAAVSEGTANVALAAKSLEPGTYQLTVAYSGDDSHEGSSTTVSVTVVKAVSTVTATATPNRLQKNKDTTTLTITVSATNVTPTGTVTAQVDGTTKTATLNSNGTATIVLGPFTTVGTKSIALTYSGDAQVASDTGSVSVTVVNGKVK